jgi:glycerol-3-phosphate acyltransferase PlsX
VLERLVRAMEENAPAAREAGANAPASSAPVAADQSIQPSAAPLNSQPNSQPNPPGESGTALHSKA